jgi:hypothetical protein
MARRKVEELVCDRCKRVELLDIGTTKQSPGPILTFVMEDKKLEYTDLCSKCYATCQNYYKQMAKIYAPGEKPPVEETPEPVKESKLPFGLGLGKK